MYPSYLQRVEKERRALYSGMLFPLAPASYYLTSPVDECRTARVSYLCSMPSVQYVEQKQNRIFFIRSIFPGAGVPASWKLRNAMYFPRENVCKLLDFLRSVLKISTLFSDLDSRIDTI